LKFVELRGEDGAREGYTVFTGALKTLEPHTQRRIDPGARAEKTDLI
jgi:hypothetical protein